MCFFICLLESFWVIDFLIGNDQTVDEIVLVIAGSVFFCFNLYLTITFFIMGFKYIDILQITGIVKKTRSIAFISFMAFVFVVGDFYQTVLIFIGAYINDL